MLTISDYGAIELTRGDTARFSVTISNGGSGDEYEPLEGDILTMTIRKSVTDAAIALQKTIPATEGFHIKPEDTAGLEFGKYMYDVQLTTVSGDVYTVIPPTEFKIAQEVSY